MKYCETGFPLIIWSNLFTCVTHLENAYSRDDTVVLTKETRACGGEASSLQRHAHHTCETMTLSKADKSSSYYMQVCSDHLRRSPLKWKTAGPPECGRYDCCKPSAD